MFLPLHGDPSQLGSLLFIFLFLHHMNTTIGKKRNVELYTGNSPKVKHTSYILLATASTWAHLTSKEQGGETVPCPWRKTENIGKLYRLPHTLCCRFWANLTGNQWICAWEEWHQRISYRGNLLAGRIEISSVILRFSIHRNHVEGLLKTQTPGPHTQSSLISGSEVGAGIFCFYQGWCWYLLSSDHILRTTELVESDTGVTVKVWWEDGG